MEVIYIDREAPVIKLNGSSSILLEEGEAYVEPGYTATDNVDGDITSKVTVTGSVNINVPGGYTLVYSVTDAAGNTGTASRAVQVMAKVIVPETPQEPPRTPPVITLTGFKAMTLEYGQAYIETGYSAVDCKGVNLTSSVSVTGTVDHWKAGLYTITYSVTDTAGLTARETRTVTVSPKPPEPPPPAAPKITINGSNPIILHRDSATPYKEQSARAIDHDGRDISNLVRISGNVSRTVAGTYTLTYSITSPTTNLTSTTTRNVRIVSPTERRDPRTSYGLSGQAKQGAKVTHTGIVSSSLGFIDVNVTTLDNKTVIAVELIDTVSKKVALKDSFSAAGKKQYKIDAGKYDFVVTLTTANGNSKYGISLLMPEAAPVLFYETSEVPLLTLPQIAPVGSNPIILHLGGTPYYEQGAHAVDFLGNDLTGEIVTTGKVDLTTPGIYEITYTVTGAANIPVSVVRKVHIVAPNEFGEFDVEEVPLPETPDTTAPGTVTYTVVRGDSLWKIAKKVLGSGRRWGEIYDMNVDIIGKDPSKIKVGMILNIKVE